MPTIWRRLKRRCTLPRKHDQSQLRCERCSSIDLEGLLQADKTRSLADLKSVQDHHCYDGKNASINLGPLNKLCLDLRCPLCDILRHLRPTASSYPLMDVYLIPARALSYLEPTVSLVQYDRETKYANLLYMGQEMTKDGAKRLPYVHEAHSAVGRAVGKDHKEAMLVRKVKRLRFNVDLVKGWLKSCHERHEETCTNKFLPELNSIRLIDTN